MSQNGGESMTQEDFFRECTSKRKESEQLKSNFKRKKEDERRKRSNRERDGSGVRWGWWGRICGGRGG